MLITILLFKILKFRHDKTCNGCAYYDKENWKCHKFLKPQDSFRVEYDDALTCRLDKFKCGPFGKYFVEKKNTN